MNDEQVKRLANVIFEQIEDNRRLCLRVDRQTHAFEQLSPQLHEVLMLLRRIVQDPVTATAILPVRKTQWLPGWLAAAVIVIAGAAVGAAIALLRRH